MGIEHNPVFILAQQGEAEGLSKAELLSIASTPRFLRIVKKDRHYREIIREFCCGLGSPGEAPSPPTYLSTIALHCASKQHVSKDILGMLHLFEGWTLLNNMRMEESLSLFQKARSVFGRMGASELFHVAAQLVSGVSLLLGRKHVDPKYRRAIRELTANEASRLEPLALIRMASTYQALGEHERAFALCASAKPSVILQAQGLQAVALHNIMAMCAFQMGKFELALDVLAQILERPDVAQTPLLSLQCGFILALVYRRLGEPKRAIDLLKKAEEYFRDRGQEIGVMMCVNQLALAYVDSGQPDLAEQVIGDAIRDYQRSGNEMAAADCEVRLAQIYRRMGLYERSLREIATARTTFEKRRCNLNLVECDAVEAWVYAEMGQHKEARRRFDSLKKRFVHLSPLMIVLEYHSGMGCSLARTGEWEKARESYEQCIRGIEELRGSMLLRNRRSSFLESRQEPYEELIGCCLQVGDTRAALEYVERLKSRSLAELLAARDVVPRHASQQDLDEYRCLKSRLRAQEWRWGREQDPVQAAVLSQEFFEARREYDRLIERLRLKNPNFDPDQTTEICFEDISGLIPDKDTALVEFYPMKDRTVAFVIRRDAGHTELSAIDEDYNRVALESDSNALRDRTQMVEILGRLYDTLIEPLRPSLCGIKKLILIPYAGLHLLPFHAMFREEDGQRTYLMDEHLVSYAPSAKILKLCLNRPTSVSHDGCVAWADPKRDLLFAQREAEAIAALHDWKILSATTRDGLIQGGRTASVFHYAGHTKDKALVLHNSEDLETEDFFDTGDIFVGLDLPRASLVTLSACDTGKIREGLTDEYIGLPSAFLHAGASTVICSLWPVSDTSTTLLMAKMYRLIEAGLGKAEALRQAQLWLKNPDNRGEHIQELEKLLLWLRPAAEKSLPDTTRFGRTRLSAEKFLPQDLAHPYHWAGFICTGAP